MNNFSPSMKAVMLPKKEPKVVRELRRAASSVVRKTNSNTA